MMQNGADRTGVAVVAVMNLDVLMVQCGFSSRPDRLPLVTIGYPSVTDQ